MATRPDTRARSHNALLDYVGTGRWALRPDVLGQFVAVINRHLAGDRIPAQTVADLVAGKETAVADRGAPRDYEVRDGVAILPVTGVIAKHAHLVNGMSQPRGTSIDALRPMLADAVDNPDARSILLVIESPGGYMDGLADFATEVYDARAAKPVIAFADDDACSAAYWIGSQADRFYGNASADIGSIGVYVIYVDSSEAAADEGIRVIPVASGPYKGTGIPGTAIADDRLVPIRHNIEQSYDLFLAAILRGREGSGLDEDALRDVADGRVFIAGEARDLHLIDAVMPLSEAYAEAVRAGQNSTLVAARAAHPLHERTGTMAKNTQPDPAASDPDETAISRAREAAQAEHRAALTALREAFPNDAARALDAAGRGLSVSEAKAEAYDALLDKSAAALDETQSRLTAVTAENERLKSLLGSKGMSAGDIAAFDPPDAAEAGAVEPGASATAEAYQTALDERITAGKTTAQAHRDLKRSMPEAFAAWTQAQQPNA